MNKYERINQLLSHLYKDKTGILKSYEAVDIPMHENYFSSGYGEIHLMQYPFYYLIMNSPKKIPFLILFWIDVFVWKSFSQQP